MSQTLDAGSLDATSFVAMVPSTKKLGHPIAGTTSATWIQGELISPNAVEISRNALRTNPVLANQLVPVLVAVRFATYASTRNLVDSKSSFLLRNMPKRVFESVCQSTTSRLGRSKPLVAMGTHTLFIAVSTFGLLPSYALVTGNAHLKESATVKGGVSSIPVSTTVARSKTLDPRSVDSAVETNDGSETPSGSTSCVVSAAELSNVSRTLAGETSSRNRPCVYGGAGGGMGGGGGDGGNGGGGLGGCSFFPENSVSTEKMSS